jgi:single-strand DNA-binding protein
VVWERLAEIVAEYAKKGKLVEVIGRQSTRKYTNRDGIEVRKTEVVADRVNFIDSGARSSSGGDDRGGSRRQGSSRGETNYPPQQEFDPELGW